MEVIGENDELSSSEPTTNNNKRPASGTPGMELICSDESSLDDSMGSRASKKSCGSSSSQSDSSKANTKRVSWDQIHTREYTLVVGDHPMCQDGLPVSLGWDHADGSPLNLQPATPTLPLVPVRERQQSYAFPKRLSYEERRDRLLNVSNLTLDQIKNDEIDLVVRTLRESWEDVGEEVLGGFGDDDALMGREGDPLAAMMGLVFSTNSTATTTDTTTTATGATMMLPGMNLDDADLGDISNFAWTDDEENENNGST
jgi:hypothetical protein